MALSVDDAASQRGYDDDEASRVCDCVRDPSCGGGEGQVYCTRYSGGCCGTPGRCPRDRSRTFANRDLLLL